MLTKYPYFVRFKTLQILTKILHNNFKTGNNCGQESLPIVDIPPVLSYPIMKCDQSGRGVCWGLLRDVIHLITPRDRGPFPCGQTNRHNWKHCLHSTVYEGGKSHQNLQKRTSSPYEQRHTNWSEPPKVISLQNCGPNPKIQQSQQNLCSTVF